MASAAEIKFVFFDIGGTLGERNPANGNFVAFPSSVGLLKAMRDELGVRVGIITTLGPQLSTPDGLALLKKAQLGSFLIPPASSLITTRKSPSLIRDTASRHKRSGSQSTSAYSSVKTWLK